MNEYKKKVIALKKNSGYLLILLMLPLVIPTQVYASHGTHYFPCKNDGLYDGQENPFSQELFEMCGNTYYEYFMIGCMSVNNTKEVCEQATDANGEGRKTTD